MPCAQALTPGAVRKDPSEHATRSREQTRLTAMMGGHMFRAKFGDPATADPAAITARALDAVRTVRPASPLPLRGGAAGPLNT